MKLSFSSLPCEGWSAQEIVDACLRFGFQGVELREGDNSVASIRSPAEERMRAANLFKNLGITVTNIGSGICITGHPEQSMDAVLQQFAENLELAADFGAKAIRIFIGNFIRRKDDPRIRLDYTRIVEMIRKACDMAASRDAAIWIESYNEFAAGRSMRILLRDINRTNCGVIWDFLHTLEDGESPGQSWADLGRHCVHVHVKDGVPAEDDPLKHEWTYVKVGEGEGRVGEIVALLLEHGYDGFFSLEWETKWRKELQTPEMKPERVFPEYTSFMRRLEKRRSTAGQEEMGDENADNRKPV